MARAGAPAKGAAEFSVAPASHHSSQPLAEFKTSTSSECSNEATSAPSSRTATYRCQPRFRACNFRQITNTVGVMIHHASQYTASERNAFVHGVTYPAQYSCEAKMVVSNNHNPAMASQRAGNRSRRVARFTRESRNGCGDSPYRFGGEAANTMLCSFSVMFTPASGPSACNQA